MPPSVFKEMPMRRQVKFVLMSLLTLTLSACSDRPIEQVNIDEGNSLCASYGGMKSVSRGTKAINARCNDGSNVIRWNRPSNKQT